MVERGLLPALPPGAGQGQMEEARHNKPTFDFIVQNNLYKRSGLKAAFGKTFLDEPARIWMHQVRAVAVMDTFSGVGVLGLAMLIVVLGLAAVVATLVVTVPCVRRLPLP